MWPVWPSADTVNFMPSKELHIEEPADWPMSYVCSWGGLMNSSPSMSSGYKTRADCSQLSTSPVTMSWSYLGELLSICDSTLTDEFSDHESSVTEDSSQGSLMSNVCISSVKHSLINDHSYGGLSKPTGGSHVRITNSCKASGMQSLLCRTASDKAKGKLKPVKCAKSKKENIKVKTSGVAPAIKFTKNGQQYVLSGKSITSVPSSHKLHEVHSPPARKHCKPLQNSKRIRSAGIVERQIPLTAVHTDPEDSSSSNDGDSKFCNLKVPPTRRREHNDSERKRRDHLRNAFLGLKDQIPKLKNADKRPPRITILHEATAYVGQLIDKQRYLNKTLEAEKVKREKLLNRLKMLQANG